MFVNFNLTSSPKFDNSRFISKWSSSVLHLYPSKCGIKSAILSFSFDVKGINALPM